MKVMRKKSVFFFASFFFVFFPVWMAYGQEKEVQAAVSGAEGTALDFANGLYIRKMYKPAITEYEKFISQYPNSPDQPSAMFRIADAYFFLKEYDQAITRFEVYLNKFPQDTRVSLAIFRIGSAKFYLKDYLSAGGMFQKLLSQEMDANTREGALFYLGKIYILRGHPEKGSSYFLQLLDCCSASDYASYAAIELGDLKFKKNNVSEALTMYRIAAEKSKPIEISLEAKLKIAEIYFTQKKYKEANDYYGQLYYGSFDKQDPSNENQARLEEIRNQSLRALFYCDTFLEDAEEIVKRFEREKPALEKIGFRLEAQWLVSSVLVDEARAETALPYLEGILADSKASAELKSRALFKKSEALMLMDKQEEALEILQGIINQKSGSQSKAWYERAKIFRRIGKYTEAIKAYETMSEAEDPLLFKKAFYEKAETYQEMNETAKAKIQFIDFAKKYSKDASAERARLEVIQIDIDEDNFETALKKALQFIEDYPSSELKDVAYYQQATALTGLNKYKESADKFRKIISDFPSSKLIVESIYGLGVSLENLGIYSEAISHFETIINSYPNSPMAPEVFTRLQSLYIKTNSLSKASFLFEDILFKKPNIPIGTEAAFWLVQYFLDNKQYQRMQKVLDIIPSRFPKQDLTHEINYFLGESSLGIGDKAKAVDYYSKSVAQQPKGPYAAYAYLGLGLAYAAQNKMIESEKNFNQAVSFDQEPKAAAHARFELGELRFNAGDYLEAAKTFMMVAIFYDDVKYSAWALYKAGICYLKLGKKEEAVKTFNELRVRYKESEWAKKIDSLDLKVNLSGKTS